MERALTTDAKGSAISAAPVSDTLGTAAASHLRHPPESKMVRF